MKKITFHPDKDTLCHTVFPNFEEITPDVALALLLLAECVFLMGARFDDTDGELSSTIFVNANDFFYYACADCEVLPFCDFEEKDEYQDFKKFYNLVKNHGPLGVYIWLIEKRKMQPIKSRIERLKEANLWKEEYNSYPSIYNLNKKVEK
jgi:hypothetical protein